ncbi:hypothetical protein EVAR_22936_1 [Eumeta japonica]|uniref:Uncharacterized protein n=1 Tax=Eumeta variegata TaxID=151549 RepID=A0A4C1UW54_EUMVA|nr:hypothetical protein EVAR_22936_1 [Eumeta japonica]
MRRSCCSTQYSGSQDGGTPALAAAAPPAAHWATSAHKTGNASRNLVGCCESKPAHGHGLRTHRHFVGTLENFLECNLHCDGLGTGSKSKQNS